MRTFLLSAAATEIFATLVPEVTVIEAERTTCELVPTVKFAKGLVRDRAAVEV